MLIYEAKLVALPDVRDLGNSSFLVIPAKFFNYLENRILDACIIHYELSE